MSCDIGDFDIAGYLHLQNNPNTQYTIHKVNSTHCQITKLIFDTPSQSCQKTVESICDFIIITTTTATDDSNQLKRVRKRQQQHKRAHSSSSSSRKNEPTTTIDSGRHSKTLVVAQTQVAKGKTTSAKIASTTTTFAPTSTSSPLTAFTFDSASSMNISKPTLTSVSFISTTTTVPVTTLVTNQTLPAAENNSPKTTSNNSLVIVIGSAVGGTVVLLILVTLTVCLCRRRSRHQKKSRGEKYYMHKDVEDDDSHRHYQSEKDAAAAAHFYQEKGNQVLRHGGGGDSDFDRSYSDGGYSVAGGGSERDGETRYATSLPGTRGRYDMPAPRSAASTPNASHRPRFSPTPPPPMMAMPPVMTPTPPVPALPRGLTSAAVAAAASAAIAAGRYDSSRMPGQSSRMPALGYGSNGRREPKQDGIDPASSSLSVDVVHRAVRGAVGPSSFPNAKAQQQMYQKDRQKAFLMLQDGSQSAYSQHSPSQESSPTLPSPTASMYYPGNAHLISMYSQPSGVAASMAASVQYTPRSNYTPGFAGPSSVAGASSSARSDWSNSHRQKRQTPAASSSSSALALSPSSRSGPNAKATPLLLTRSHTATTTKTSTSSSTFKSAKSSKSALRTPNQFRDNSSDYFLHGTSAAYIDLIPVEDTPGISHASLHRVPSTLSSVSRVSKASKSSRGKGKERKVDQEEKDAYASLYGKMKAGGMGYGNSNSGGSSSRAYGGKGNIVGGGSALGRYHEEYEDDEEDDAEIRYL